MALSVPIYDISQSYDDNFRNGPVFEGEFPIRELPPKNEWTDFLGYKVASRLGVPAGPLLNAQWIDLAGKLGFDIVTYKTIRSRQHPCHPWPNVVCVETGGMITADRFNEVMSPKNNAPSGTDELAITNSFGMPSQGSDFLMEDIERANRCLKEGQILIVSVVGSELKERTLAEDFAYAAALAKGAGAKIIELNFSCPNVWTGLCVYANSQTVCEIASHVRKVVSDTPLIIKVGPLMDKTALSEMMLAACRGGINAINGINSIKMKVCDREGKPALGEGRAYSGICGSAIRQVALDFVRLAQEVNQELKLGLTIIGVGGIMETDHFDQFFDSGADIAMTATGMMWDPYLAMKYHQSKS